MRDQIERLRREFDESFARPEEERPELVPLLGIRVAGRPFALSLGELGGTAAGARIVPVPARSPALIGLAGIRGRVVPVFDLATLFGETRPGAAPRWIALSQGSEAIGLAFSELEGHLERRPEELGAYSGEGQKWIRGALRGERELRPVIDVSAIAASVRETATGKGTKGPVSDG
ncbi:MAG: hypothetical protein B6A08_15760 [Sorangiineae bacterium NIC37A_2]|nr:MAG: hypothetical protein B6A08_15760 [Sorangiineae bacterium NIC37A_2]